MKMLFVVLTAFLCSLTVQSQKFENLALTPPMGWNSWNKFGCDVNEKLIRDVGDAMVSSGMRDAGYQYIVIDDCWHGKRDDRGFIHPDRDRFPSGMKTLADYIHSQGLKLGIYSDAGDKTCGGRPGSRGHEYQDALSYAEWGIDYLKYDWCNTEGLRAEGAYTTMRDALRAAGRPVVFSLCEWGNNKPWEWAKTIGHLWRTTGDIYNCFDCVQDHGTWKQWGMLQILDMQKDLRVHAGPGHWNDPDMMEVGNGMSDSEDRAHFSMWSMLAAPLIAGNDLRNMKQQTHDILTNREVIAVDRDSLGIQGFKYTAKDGLETWFKPLKDDSWAVCFLNRGSVPHQVDFDWKKQMVSDDVSKREFDPRRTSYQIRDLWLKKSLGTTEIPLKATVPGHDVLLVQLSR